MAEIIEEGVVKVDLDDRAVYTGIDRMVAKIKSDLETIRRERTVINVKYNVEDAKRALAELKVAEQRLTDKIEERQAKLDAAEGKAKAGHQTKLNRLKEEQKALEADTNALRSHITEAEKSLRTGQRLMEQEKSASREREKASALRVAEWKKENDLIRDHTAAIREDAKREADRTAAQMKDIRTRNDALRENARWEDHREAVRKRAAADEREAGLRQLEVDAKRLAMLKQASAAQERMNQLADAHGRAQGSDKQRVAFEFAKADAEFKVWKEKLRLEGMDPIEQKVKIDKPSAGAKLADLFGFGKKDDIKDVTARLADLAKNAKGARLNIGPLSGSLSGLAAGAAALAPILVGLVGTLGSLTAAVGAGVAGAAGLGASGLMGFGMAAIGIKAQMQPLMEQITTVRQAINQAQSAALKYGPPTTNTPAAQNASARAVIDLQRYDAAVAKSGANSIQAQSALLAYHTALQRASTGANQSQRALNRLNSVIANMSPVTRQAYLDWNKVATQWHALTDTSAAKNFGSVLNSTMTTMLANVKFYAKDTNQAFTNVAAGWGQFMGMLRSPDAQKSLDGIFKNFNKTLPSIFDALTHLGHTWLMVMKNFSDYLPGLASGFDKWAGRVDAASNKSGGFAKGVGIMVESFKTLGHFLGSATRFLFEFFRAGVGPGNSLITDMNKGLDRMNANMSTVAGQKKLIDFFKTSNTTTKQLWNALVPLVKVFVAFSQAMAPVANIALTLVTIFTKLVAALVSFKPLQYFAGFLLGVAIVGRLTSGLQAMGSAAWDAVKALDRAVMLRTAGASWGSAFKGAFGGSDEAGKMLAVHREGAAIIETAIVTGHTRGAAILADAEVAGHARGAAIVAEAEVAGAVPGAVGAGGAAVGAGEAAGGVGILGLLKKGGLKAAGIGVGGIVASQLIGGAVGGKAGGAIKTVGGFAAGGAALGSIIPGVGTVAGGIAGAAVGGLVEGFKLFNARHAHDLGKEAANKFTEPFSAALKAATGGATDQALRNLTNKADHANDPSHHFTVGRGGGAIGGNRPAAGADQTAWDAVGRQAGEDFNKAFATAKSPSQFLFIQDIQQELAALNPKARAAAAQTAIEFARGMVSKGQMTKGAFAGLVASLETQIPGLEDRMRQAGLTSSGEFARSLTFGGARNKLAQMLTDYKAWGVDTAISTKITGSNLNQNMLTAMNDLQAMMHTGPKKGREAAKREFELLRSQVKDIFGQSVWDVNWATNQMSDSLKHHSKTAVDAASNNFSRLQSNIAAAMASGQLATDAGVQLIADALNNILKAFGEAPLGITTIKNATASQLQQVAAGHITSGGLASPHATGGRVPGAVGTDDWTLVDSSGRARAKVGGAELLIANRHTEAAASKATMAVYGKTLGQMVNGETRPHYAPGYATGGTVVQGPVSTFGPPGEPAHATAAGKSSADPGVSLRIAGTNWDDPRNRALMGHMFRVSIAGHTGTLPDIDLGPNQWTGRDIDVTGAGARVMGFDPATFPTNSIGTATMIGGGSIGGSGGSGSGTGVQQVTAPRVQGKGAIGRMVQGALDKAANAANAYISAHQPTMSIAQGGGAMPAGTVMATGGKPAQVETAMIAAANQILGLPYIYGGGHGSFSAPGYDCSGAVSYVLHAAGLLGSPESTDGLKNFGEPGGGKYITIGVRGSSGPNAHTMMSFFGKFFESGGTGGGPHWDQTWDGYFPISRHPKGFTTGGRVGNFGEVDPGTLLEHAPGLAKDPEFINYAKHHRKRNKFAGAFAQGGSFTANSPTFGLFGENGPETVVAIPHAATGGQFSQNYIPPKPPSHPGAPGHHGFTPHRTTREKGPHYGKYVESLKPRDRIGGIGTADLDQAVKDSKKALDAFVKTLKHQTHTITVPTTHNSSHRTRHVDKSGHVTYTSGSTTTTGTAKKKVHTDASPAQQHHEDQLRRRYQHFLSLDTRAKNQISEFASLETQITAVNNALTAAGSNPQDEASGFDPVTGKFVIKKWDAWHRDLMGLETKHRNKLRIAAREVTRTVGKDKGAEGLGYVQAIQAAYGQGLIDFNNADVMTDPNVNVGTATTVDEYLKLIPKSYTDRLGFLNYAYSQAQGNNVPDNPGTPQREDLASMQDDLFAAGALKDFYKGIMQMGQSDPKAQGNWPLLTALSDAFNSAQSTWQGIQDQFTAATLAGGPTQIQNWGAARQAMFNNFGSNIIGDTISGIGGGMSAADTAGMAVRPPVGTVVTAGPSGQPAQNVKHVNVTNHYAVPPEDAHSWSQGIGWELEHAL